MTEERVPGTRKPYRISKPREKWTEDEHNRFVTAINQHGRNWRKIVQEVGTRSVAQVRSHAQKYFLKLEKNGNTEEVPPARAKRPSTKPYPMKNSGHEGSNKSSQSSQLQSECKRPRRTERTITKPLQNDYTLLEESPRISTECDSIAFLLSEEGNGSNNNMAPAQALQGNNSGTNGPSASLCQRQSSALSSAELNPAAGGGVGDHTAPSPDSALFPQDSFVDREHSDPTDASSGAVGKPDRMPPNYGEFFDAVGKMYTNQQGSNKQLIQQLGAHQRSELVHMLDHLSGELKDSVSSKDPAAQPLPPKPVTGLPITYGECELAGLPAAEIVPSMTCQFPSPCSLNDGGSASNLVLLDQEVSTPHDRCQGSDLLALDTQPPDLESSAWRLSMSDDLGVLLPNPAIDCSPYNPSQMIDSKIFDY